MSLSLLHYNPDRGTAAVVSATALVAIGGYVPHCWRGLGGCATQGYFTNPWYAHFTYEQLKQKKSAQDIVKELEKRDLHASKRQCLVIDNNGDAAVLQGSENKAVFDALIVKHTAVAGNMLTSSQVLKDFLTSFVHSCCSNADQVLCYQAQPLYFKDYENDLVPSLLNALEAALLTGGDERGNHSAALRVESYQQAPLDIRVDWVEDDLLAALHQIWKKMQEQHYQDFYKGVALHLNG